MNYIFLLSFFCFFVLEAMNNQLNLADDQNNEAKISFLDNRLDHSAKEIAKLKTENESLKKQIEELLPLYKDYEIRTLALENKIKNLENKRSWKFGEISQKTKALMC